MGFASFDEQGNRSVMDERGLNDTVSPSSSEVDSSLGSEESDDNSMEDHEVNSSSSLSSSPNSPFSYSTASPSGKLATGDSLSDMSSLLQQLPFKRGLSKHFQGKSQSFTCLSNVRCLEDLAKPENPCNKKLKSCKSYVGFGFSAETQNRSSSNDQKLLPSSRQISKKTSRGSCSSLVNYAKRSNNCIGGSLLGHRDRDRPPIHPLRSTNSTTNISNQTQTQTHTSLFV